MWQKISKVQSQKVRYVVTRRWPTHGEIICQTCCDPRADPVDTGRALVHMLDRAASALTVTKRVTEVIHSNVSLLSLFYFRIATRQADPSRLALLLINTLVLSFHPTVS
jgi:hypothetical protein